VVTPMWKRDVCTYREGWGAKRRI